LKTWEELLGIKPRCGIAAVLIFFIMAVQYGDNAYAASNDKLDVNLNVLYVGTRTQKGSNVLGETIIQFPFPLTENARDTGQGPFGGISYYDNKALVSNVNQLVSEVGLGRIYYSYSVPGDMPYTFVPYVTFYRTFLYNYKNTLGLSAEQSGHSFLLPGVMYAYRFNEKIALHLDAEIYSYSEINNNRVRFGFSYSPVWPWIISFSRENLAWDIDGREASANGNSRENNIKIIFRDPPQGNFALHIGYGNTMRTAFGPDVAGQVQGTTYTKGTFFGIEASGGVLAW
jgi:hypothetical protein